MTERVRFVGYLVAYHKYVNLFLVYSSSKDQQKEAGVVHQIVRCYNNFQFDDVTRFLRNHQVKEIIEVATADSIHVALLSICSRRRATGAPGASLLHGIARASGRRRCDHNHSVQSH
jgi:hypothetical protein